MNTESVYQFTYDFLQEFFGTTKYFNVNEIAIQATPKIKKRMREYKKYDCYSILLDPDVDEEDEDYQDAQTQLEYDFVQDLFDVTDIPIQWAYRLCKGDCPNGDCIDDEGVLNLKYNKRILQWIKKSKNENGK